VAGAMAQVGTRQVTLATERVLLINARAKGRGEEKKVAFIDVVGHSRGILDSN